MDKSPDAFRTISEVATELDLPQHVLRFWETRFSQIKPMKRGGGRRYYRPEDVELLCGIRHLLYGEGYTIKGVQRILKEQGVRYVMDIWREGDEGEADDAAAPSGAKTARVEPSLASKPSRAPSGSSDEADDEGYGEPSGGDEEEAYDEAAAPETAPAADQVPEIPAMLSRRQDTGTRDAAPRARRPEPADAEGPPARGVRGIVQERASGPPVNGDEAERMPRDVLADDEVGEPAAARSSFRFMERLRGGEGRRDSEQHEPGQQLAKDDIRRLQATLFELLECKRLLDQAR